jgi:hypothetical protein
MIGPIIAMLVFGFGIQKAFNYNRGIRTTNNEVKNENTITNSDDLIISSSSGDLLLRERQDSISRSSN